MTSDSNTYTETRQPFSPAQKYFIKPECKNMFEEFVLYTTYILLHIATIHTSPYCEGKILFDRR